MPKTIADGSQTQVLGPKTFEMMPKLVDEIMDVSDEDLVECMKFYSEKMKMVVEPTGCLSLAGLRKYAKEGKIPKGSRCACIISGGNVDLERFIELIK